MVASNKQTSLIIEKGALNDRVALEGLEGKGLFVKNGEVYVYSGDGGEYPLREDKDLLETLNYIAAKYAKIK